MEQYINYRFKNLLNVAEDNKHRYLSSNPFPNIVLKDFFNPEILDRVLREFPDLSNNNDSKIFDTPLEKKLTVKQDYVFGKRTKIFMNFLNSQPFLHFIQILTGINETLLGDPYFEGGGLHQIKRGGCLKVHADFNKHRLTGLDRRVNILIYLNKNWKNDYGGNLELWDRDMKFCVKRIVPEFNTVVIFNTTDYTYHGHPDPLNCPHEVSRKSLALYYFSNGRPEAEINPDLPVHSTLFKERAGNINDESEFSKYRMRSIIAKLVPRFLYTPLKRLMNDK